MGSMKIDTYGQGQSQDHELGEGGGETKATFF
jgi:hypothetical protein